MKLLINSIKIILLTFVFALVFHFSYGYFNSETKTKPYSLKKVDSFKKENNNKYKFKQSDSEILSNVGVALSTNVGIRYKQRKEQNLYKDLPSIAKYISQKKFSDKTTLSRHLVNIKEYYNVLRTDIKQMLNKAYDRKAILEAYIDQLKYRYKLASNEMKSLVKKKQEFSNNLNKANQKIKTIKINITKDFKELNDVKIDQDIEELLVAKADYNYNKTYIIFINQYLKQYQNLNKTNKKLLDTLINNKEALIKNAKVVIPDTGTEFLKKLDLIIDEKKYKTK